MGGSHKKSLHLVGSKSYSVFIGIIIYFIIIIILFFTVDQDYYRIVSVFLPFLTDGRYYIRTISRAGTQHQRNLTFGFINDSPLTRFERQKITIIITDRNGKCKLVYNGVNV